MTLTPLAAVVRVLAGEAIETSTYEAIGAPHRRLIDAIALHTEGHVGARDLVALVRHVLRYESEHQGVDQHLRVPRDGWPLESHWLEASCSVVVAGPDRFVISAQPWRPAWIDEPTGDVGRPAEGGTRRRHDLREPGDAFLVDALGPAFTRYSSIGQKQAIRAVLAAEPGATLLVNLPTGSGKSAVALAPAILHSNPTGVSVVVVPTTSLALDQERAALQHLASGSAATASNERLAYYSDQPETERQAIRNAIREGRQRLLFTSPESLIQSLAPSLYAAAAAGHLRYLTIDEAHTVASWGVDFRPEFQALSGFRRDLLREIAATARPGFKTILMSATITEDAVDTLTTLFGDPGPMEIVSSVFIRPEPEYWISSARSEDERRDRLLEAARHLPRPAIVYVSQPAHAEQIASALRSDGHRRVRVVSGSTTAAARLRAIQDWRGDDLSHDGSTSQSRVDVIVGTSAFGLGVDQSDVRAVVHACLPESIDRYYQEVGRGGRDGRSSLALLVHTPADRGIAETLSSNRVIGVELGLERWKSMLESKRPLGDNRFQVSLDARRSEIWRGSRENEAWNLRTIALMMRAGLLRLDAERPPLTTEEMTPDETDEAFRHYITSAVVEIIDPGHLDPATWARVVEPARRKTIKSSRLGFALMMEVLAHTRDLSGIFVDAYRVTHNTALGPAADVAPQGGCGGCVDCRAHGRHPYANRPSTPEGLAHPASTLSSGLAELVDASGPPLIVTFDPDEPRRTGRWPEFTELLGLLVRNGVRLLSASPTVLALPAVATAHRKTRDGFLFTEPNPAHLFAPRVATLIVHDPFVPRPVVPRRYFQVPSRPHPRIILIPRDARDPERPDHDVIELRHPNVDVDTLLSIL